MITAIRIGAHYAGFRARRRLGRTTPLEAAAAETWEIAPPETRETGPAVRLPGQFEKIRAFDRNTKPETERLRVFGGRVSYPAVRARRFANATLHKGSVLCNRGEKRVRPFGRAAPEGEYPPVFIREGVLTGSYLGLLYFGHWLRDDLTMALMAEGLGEPFTLATCDWPHIEGYRRLCGLSCRELENAVFRSLIVFDDEEITPHKVLRLAELRRRVAVYGEAAAKKVFILRGGVERGRRRFVNEREIAETLAKEGFAIINPMTASIKDIAVTMHGARIVIGAEGSQLCHAVPWLAEDGALLAITPPERFTTSHKRWAELLGVKYGFIVGDPSTDGGFSANVNDVLRTIDLLDSSSARADAR